MTLDWPLIDRWLMGEAWTGSQISTHLTHLSETIGPRWSSSEAEWQTINYIQDQFQIGGLNPVAVEEYQMDSWRYSKAEANLIDDRRSIQILPFNFCPPFQLEAPLVDVGFGTHRELEAVKDTLPGAIAVIKMAFEPFTPPTPHTLRLKRLAEADSAAAIVIDKKSGRRVEYHNATDWRDTDQTGHPLPTVATSREDGALLQKLARAGQSLHLTVESEFYTAPSANVAGQLTGALWPDEHLVLGGHHDTVYGAPGGNDNSTGTIAVLETARVLAKLQDELGVQLGRSIRFVTYSAEEQKFQGSTAYVKQHYLDGGEMLPRLSINLDELSTGHMKGLVLAFPHLREIIQAQLDTMQDGLQCHVMAQLDPTSDHFPFLKAGIDAAHLWRWRFQNRHADADYHHEAADTYDKLNRRELKEYVGQLARTLLRLSHIPPQLWPENEVATSEVEARLAQECGQVIRVF